MIQNVKFNIFDAAGWYGAVAVLASYVLVSAEWLGPHSFWFHFLNLTGGVGVAAIAYKKRVMQPVIINGFRAIIALGAIGAMAFSALK